MIGRLTLRKGADGRFFFACDQMGRKVYFNVRLIEIYVVQGPRRRLKV